MKHQCTQSNVTYIMYDNNRIRVGWQSCTKSAGSQNEQEMSSSYQNDQEKISNHVCECSVLQHLNENILDVHKC